MRSVITVSHTQSSCFTIYLYTSVILCVKAGGWISIFTATQSVPHTPLSDSHIIQSRKSCSSFINIWPCSQKPQHSQQKNMAAYSRQNIHHCWERGGGCRALGGNCRLFAQTRQCCVCLLLGSVASWLTLLCHRTGIMVSLAIERKSAPVSYASCPH